MNTLFATLVLVSAATLSGQRFPTLSGETATGRTVELPAVGPKGFTIVGMAYSKKAGPLLEEWYEPAYLRFVAKHGLFASAYDADLYFIPLFVGANKAAYEPSLRKFRKSASPEIVDHVVFCRENGDEVIEALEMNDKDVPYFFILDAEGTIVYRTQGAFTEAKLEAMEAVLLN